MPPVFPKDTGMHSPVPWEVTPGFYAADPASALAGDGGDASAPAAARSSLLRGIGRTPGRDFSNFSANPQSLEHNFQTEDEENENRKLVQREPLVDLAHLPEAAKEAAAVTKAAVEAASETAVLGKKRTPRTGTVEQEQVGAAAGEERRQHIGSVFGKFTCKK